MSTTSITKFKVGDAADVVLPGNPKVWSYGKVIQVITSKPYRWGP